MKIFSRFTSLLPSDGPEPAVFRVATFVGEDSAGVSHCVVVNPSASDEGLYQEGVAEDEILVFLFLEPDGARADFYQSGHAIKRCGSGTVAAAHVLDRELGLPLMELRTAAEILPLQRRGDRLGFRREALPLQRVNADSFWSGLVNEELRSCLLVGGEDDYALVELADEMAVAKVRVDLEALRRSSKRALILTAAATQKTCDYVFRYFAPQYGLAESAVTASVNAELGCFWSRQLKRPELVGHQLSAQGAMFLVRVESSCAWVMGKTRPC